MTGTNARTESTTTWKIDPAHTLVEFTAKHMMITNVRGRFASLEGSIEIDENNPNDSSVTVELDASSIDTRVEQRDQHLRSADFLDVESFPKVTFRSTSVEGASFEQGESFRVMGDLTIRGTTREVVLDATFEGRGRDPWGGERVSFSADTKIDRRDFGLTWNAALETGGVLVGNEVKIHIEAQAVLES
ncbi:MAG TPA: YceI family protein [Gemmatimonadaceae bacterium]|jgi:polyisoprenoid-binding protein YceI|nr:YceI family protein [Gemmatimonadaceae bacterium]